MIFAVLSTNSVMLYDTQHEHMICMVRHQHFANLTDVAWSNDGLLLIVTSTDGYCSVIEFDEGELGTPLARSAYPSSLLVQRPKIEMDFGSADHCARDSLRNNHVHSKKRRIVPAHVEPGS